MSTITIKPPFVCAPCRGIGRRLQVLGPSQFTYDHCAQCQGRGTARRIDTSAWMDLWRARVDFGWPETRTSEVRGFVATRGVSRPAVATFRPEIDRLPSYSSAGALGGSRS